MHLLEVKKNLENLIFFKGGKCSANSLPSRPLETYLISDNSQKWTPCYFHFNYAFAK